MLDIVEAIASIREAVEGETYESFIANRIKKAAVERFIEIVSEASRHIPDDVKQREAQLPWRNIAGIGNILRHAYHDTDPAILWNICHGPLDELEGAIRRAAREYPDVGD